MSIVAKPKIFIIFYSLYGHLYTVAQSIKLGVEKANNAEVHLFQLKETLSPEVLAKMHAPAKPNVPILVPEDLAAADAFLFGIPTRFGNMPEQWKNLWDATGQLWMKGALVGKFAGIFFSTASQHGGQETTALTFLTTLAHHGIMYVPFGNRSSYLMDHSHIIGGSAYGSGTITNGDGSRMPSQEELEIAEAQCQPFATMYSPGFAIFAVLLSIGTFYLYSPVNTLLRAGNLFGNVTAVNTDTCRLVSTPLLEGCEHVAIHHDSGLAFTACSLISTRMKWLPTAGRTTVVPENDTVFVYNLKTDEVQPLVLTNYDGELKGFGLDVRTSEKDPKSVILMITSVASTGAAVEIFRYQLPNAAAEQTEAGKMPLTTLPTTLTHLETVRHKLIRNPNSVVALSDRAFYVTNINYYKGGVSGLFEVVTAQPWATVMIRREDGAIELAARGIAGANGIVVNYDRSKAFVASSTRATVNVYRIAPSGTLHLAETVKVPVFPDNLSQDPVTGEIYIAGAAKFVEYLKYTRKPSLATSKMAGVRVLRFHNNTGPTSMLGINYAVDEFLVEPGELMPTGSTAAYDPTTRKMVIGGLMGPGLLVCQF
ncbi:hypothetical protein IWQ60_010151 [Tieghemiomyces parasiticus]|uniref:Flavodoxin-like domain-containing protein n=1 Tax=Tieghemiomyces parasiticus TaxID=78921 RepID=A0A9W8DIT8_9FUNG|nr:hypothetical protein IWQ60_010151 [Tieghemiomyces parasiticus]